MLNIIFENKELLVVNKPNNLSTQKNSNYQLSLEKILEEKYSYLSPLPRCGIIHRLDRQTTGLILIAKDLKNFNYLTKIFKERKIKKIYLALVEGIVENKSGHMKFYAKKKFSKKNPIKVILDKQQGKLVDIFFQVIERLENHTLLEFYPITGRTHQIRVTCQEIGHSLVNDPLYNYCPESEIGQYLHAYSLEFIDRKGKLNFFKASIPDFFIKKLEELKSKSFQNY